MWFIIEKCAILYLCYLGALIDVVQIPLNCVSTAQVKQSLISTEIEAFKFVCYCWAPATADHHSCNILLKFDRKK